MITIKYEIFFLILAIEAILVYFGTKSLCNSPKEYTSCDYKVISKKTGLEYNCIAMRDKEEYGLELLIYNYYTGMYEWHSVYHFEIYSK